LFFLYVIMKKILNGEDRVEDKYKLKYPLLLVHGMGFRDRRRLNYWGRIPKLFEEMGNEIYYGNQDSNGSIEDNALAIKGRIEEILKATGAKKVNIIAHSKGGLDARYAISSLGMGDRVASLTTVATPHHGSITVEKLLRAPDFLVKAVGFCTDCWFGLLGDKNPKTYRVFHQFKASSAKEFNEINRDHSDVYYQSYGFKMKRATSDMFMWLTYIAVKKFDGDNDGLVGTESMMWGSFKGVYTGVGNRGISHCDEVDMRRRRFSTKKGEGISDITELYSDILKELYFRGF